MKADGTHKHHIIPRFQCKELGIHPDDLLNDTITVPALDHANIHWEHKIGSMELLLAYCTPTQFQIDNLRLGDKRHAYAAAFLADGMIDDIDTSGENNVNWMKRGKDSHLWGVPRKEETKKKISITQKKRFAKKNSEGQSEAHGMIGYKMSEENNKAKSKRMMGEGNPNYGKRMPMKQRKLISEANLGKKKGPQSEEHIKKRLEARKGYKHSEETKKKIRESKVRNRKLQFNSLRRIIYGLKAINE
jgi:hypothetical protein